MLKEQIITILEDTELEKNKTNASDQILNLFKAEVDKLTVIDTYPSVEFKAEVKSQLQHDKQTLLDLMGE